MQTKERRADKPIDTSRRKASLTERERRVGAAEWQLLDARAAERHGRSGHVDD